MSTTHMRSVILPLANQNIVDQINQETELDLAPNFSRPDSSSNSGSPICESDIPIQEPDSSKIYKDLPILEPDFPNLCSDSPIPNHIPDPELGVDSSQHSTTFDSEATKSNSIPSAGGRKPIESTSDDDASGQHRDKRLHCNLEISTTDRPGRTICTPTGKGIFCPNPKYALSISATPTIPTNVITAKSNPAWRQAMEEEITARLKNNTWS